MPTKERRHCKEPQHHFRSHLGDYRGSQAKKTEVHLFCHWRSRRGQDTRWFEHRNTTYREIERALQRFASSPGVPWTIPRHWHCCVGQCLLTVSAVSGNACPELFSGVPDKQILDLFTWGAVDHSTALALLCRAMPARRVCCVGKCLPRAFLGGSRHPRKRTLSQISPHYPIVVTRELSRAKEWLREKARGTERYGIVVSSQAERLKPHAIDVKSPMDPIHWFLDGKQDVRSSYYLEDVATEFDVQGLELDWTCVTWDADFRYSKQAWEHLSFVVEKWNSIKKPDRQAYQKNAYRVLLTRARQGMVIVVPNGDQKDPTRKSDYYDPTFNYLKRIGFETL